MKLTPNPRSLASTLLAGAGGWLLAHLGIPLGWLIGSLLTVVLTQPMGLKPVNCKPVMRYVRSGVGTLLGATVTLSFLQLVLASWPSILFLILSMILTIGSGYLLLYKGFKVSPTTALLCSIPGGMTEMAMMSERAGCDQVQVATTHLFRVALAVLIMPLAIAALYHIEINRNPAGSSLLSMSIGDWALFALCVFSGAYFEKRFNMQATVILIPFALCAALHMVGLTDFTVPRIVVDAAQLIIGINLGSKFGALKRSSLRRVALTALTAVLCQIAIAVGLGILASTLLFGDAITYIIAYAPGGLAEMSIIAVAMHLEAAFVALNHLFRLIASLLIAPSLLAFVERTHEENL